MSYFYHTLWSSTEFQILEALQSNYYIYYILTSDNWGHFCFPCCMNELDRCFQKNLYPSCLFKVNISLSLFRLKTLISSISLHKSILYQSSTFHTICTYSGSQNRTREVHHSSALFLVAGPSTCSQPNSTWLHPTSHVNWVSLALLSLAGTPLGLRKWGNGWSDTWAPWHNHYTCTGNQTDPVRSCLKKQIIQTTHQIK
jgi:hypothetical protein